MRTSILSLAGLLVVATWAVAHAQEPRDERAQEGEMHADARVSPDAQPTATQQESSVDEELLSGHFVLAGSQERAQERLDRAISRAVADMSFLTRGFAADRLREKNPIRESLRTEVDGERVAITYGDASYETRSGDWKSVVATGERVELLQTASGEAIYQTFRAEDGEKTTIYRFTPEGVTLDITLTSPRLPAPLKYSLSYRRSGEQPAVASR